MAPLIPDDAPGWAIRLEAKLDIAIVQHGQAIESLSREVADLRRERERDSERLEAADAVLAAADAVLDGRIDAHDRANYITPRQLRTALLSGAALVAAVTPFVDRLYS